MRTYTSMVLFLVAPLLTACPNERGPASPSSEVPVDFRDVDAVGGQVLSLNEANQVFAADAVFDGFWLKEGVVVATGRWAVSAPTSLVTVVPTTLEGGRYDLRIPLAAGRLGIATVLVTPSSPVVDPVASLQAWTTQATARAATQRSLALALQPSPIRDALLADLDNLDERIPQLEAGIASASPGDQQLLATMLAVSSPASGGTDVVDPDQNWNSARNLVVTSSATWDYGVGLVVAGIALGGSLGWTGYGAAVAAGLIVAGGLMIVEGVQGMTQAYEMLLRPIDGMNVDDTDVGPPWFSGLAATNLTTLTITSGIPRSITASANFATLSEAERTSGYPAAGQIFQNTDAARAKQSGLSAAFRSIIATEYPAVPAQANLRLGPIDMSRVSLVSQSNPAVQVSFVGGQLTAVLVGTANQTTTLTLRYDAGILGSLETSIECQVLGRPTIAGQWVLESYRGLPMGATCGESLGCGGFVVTSGTAGMTESSWVMTINALLPGYSQPTAIFFNSGSLYYSGFSANAVNVPNQAWCTGAPNNVPGVGFCSQMPAGTWLFNFNSWGPYAAVSADGQTMTSGIGGQTGWRRL
jgi:hypothetical protein